MKICDPLSNGILGGCQYQEYAVTGAALGAAAGWVAANAGTIAAVGGAVAGLAGAGVSAYSSMQQARSAQSVADYNLAAQQQNLQIQAKIAQRQTEINQQANAAKVKAQLENSAAMTIQARAIEAETREKARRMREEGARAIAVQRTKYAKSGVVNEGTPLAVMAETAGLIELGVQDASYEGEMSARAWDRKAAVEKINSDFTAIDSKVMEYEAAAASIGRKLSNNQAKIDHLAGSAQAQGYRTAAFGNLLSGVAGASSMMAGVDWSKTASFAPYRPKNYTGTVGTMIY